MASIAEKSLAAAGLFEAEVLTELLLWRWDHPSKNDMGFRESLLEDAAHALRRAVAGEQLIESVPAAEMSLIAAIYYVEWSWLSSGDNDPDGARQRWLDHVRRSLPSCFCSQSDLPPT
jgi:hypothetical protein